jgi:hypothetical protein
MCVSLSEKLRKRPLKLGKLPNGSRRKLPQPLHGKLL